MHLVWLEVFNLDTVLVFHSLLFNFIDFFLDRELALYLLFRIKRVNFLFTLCFFFKMLPLYLIISYFLIFIDIFLLRKIFELLFLDILKCWQTNKLLLLSLEDNQAVKLGRFLYLEVRLIFFNMRKFLLIFEIHKLIKSLSTVFSLPEILCFWWNKKLPCNFVPFVYIWRFSILNGWFYLIIYSKQCYYSFYQCLLFCLELAVTFFSS